MTKRKILEYQKEQYNKKQFHRLQTRVQPD